MRIAMMRVVLCCGALVGCTESSGSGGWTSESSAMPATSSGGASTGPAGAWKSSGMTDKDRADGLTLHDSAYTFSPDGSWSSVERSVHAPSASFLPGCVEVSNMRGSYTTTGNTIAMQIQSGATTRSACQNAGDNQSNTPMGAPELELSNAVFKSVRVQLSQDQMVFETSLSSSPLITLNRDNGT